MTTIKLGDRVRFNENAYHHGLAVGAGGIVRSVSDRYDILLDDLSSFKRYKLYADDTLLVPRELIERLPSVGDRFKDRGGRTCTLTEVVPDRKQPYSIVFDNDLVSGVRDPRWPYTNLNGLTPVDNEPMQQLTCTCSSHQIFCGGCVCGQMAREREAQCSK